MKIMLISTLYGNNGGGAGIVAERLANGLLDLGNQVTVVTMGNAGTFVEDPGRLKIIQFTPRSIYPFTEKDLHPWWHKVPWQLIDIYNPYSAKSFRNILNTEEPDIVHIHKMRGFSGAVWSESGKCLPGRVIQTCHDYESMSPDGVLRGAIGKMVTEKRWPIRAYQKIRARLTAGISIVTAPSHFTLQKIMDTTMFPNARIGVVPNSHGWSSTELERMQEEPAYGSNKFHFLYLGRLEHEKGVANLCEAFLRVYPFNPNIKLDIAGWGTLDMELRHRYGGHPGIRFLGAVEGKTKEAALRNTAVVVIPSLVDEVFGLVTVEAYAFGKPVIASQIGGLPELVHVHETGWLVAPGDVDALAEQLKSVAKTEPVVLKKMSQNCKEYSYKFAVEKVLREYLKRYGELIQ
jgi:glycosyltransferase involved in cell wall biosynthesis